MVDRADRHHLSDFGLDRIPRSHVGSTVVAPVAVWAWRELGLRPKRRLLGSFDFQDVHLDDSSGGRMAHAMGEAIREIAGRLIQELRTALMSLPAAANPEPRS